MKVGTITVGLVAWAAVTAVAHASPLDDLRARFTVGGEPVSPLVFHDFGAGQNRRHPTIVAVDVKHARDGERYAPGFPLGRMANGMLSAKWSNVTFGYKFIGTTANKLLVALVSDDWDEPKTESAIYVMDAAAKDERLVLSVVRTVQLGRAWQGMVTLKGNTIVITSAPGNEVNKTKDPQIDKLEARRPPPAKPASALLDELRAHFTIRKTPVSPVVFEDFGENAEEDTEPTVVGFDLDEAQAEKYFDSKTALVDGWLTGQGDEGTYGYRFIGKTQNNMLAAIVKHRVEAVKGPEMIYSLWVCDAFTESALDDNGGDGVPYTRVVLAPVTSMVIGNLPPSSKWNGSVKINGNTITYPAWPVEAKGPKTRAFEAKRY